MKDWKYYVKLTKYHKLKRVDFRLVWLEITAGVNPFPTIKSICESYLFRLKNKFAREDAWNTNYCLALYVLPRLAYMRDEGVSYPYGIANRKEWEKILTKIIRGFELYIKKEHTAEWNWTPKEKAIFKQAKELFAQYFEDFWD